MKMKYKKKIKKRQDENPHGVEFEGEVTLVRLKSVYNKYS